MPLLRHPAITPPALGTRRHSVTTLISDIAAHGGDPSCLLIRRRLPAGAAGSRLILRGHFDDSVRPRLLAALAALPADDRPLAVDLTDVISLDRDTLHLLLARSPGRPVVFRVAAAGAVRRLIVRLGLEERMGLAGGIAPEAAAKVPALPDLPLAQRLTLASLRDAPGEVRPHA